MVRHIAMARRLAWTPPRFEAADFAAAVVAVLKDRGGSTYLTEYASAHADRECHYRIEPVHEDYRTRVLLTISRPSWDRKQGDVQVFQGEIPEAVSKFDAIGETAKQPREYQILMTAEGSLWRAHKEISALCGDRPDPDTEQVFADIEQACRDLATLRQHLEVNDPWRTLAPAERALQRVKESQETPILGLSTVEVNLGMDAHRRFQRSLSESDLEGSEQ
ncbi:MAG: hypothetical protein ACRBBS_09380 [Thalassovita sp.]